MQPDGVNLTEFIIWNILGTTLDCKDNYGLVVIYIP